MLDHLIFITYLSIFLFSNIGYGYLFASLFLKDLKKLNFGYLGIIGFFFIVLLSMISSLFVPHNYIHNTILHSIGLLIFFINILNNDIRNIKNLKKIILIFLIFGSGIYLFKNHDDFPYYHLTYALNLSENGFIIGLGHLGHGFRTMSSLFYYHSTLYLPFIKFYLFHSGPFYILIFFNYIILIKIIDKLEEKKIDIIYFFSILNFIFVNVAFYRISEHGTDRSGQILLFLVFVIFLEIFYLKIKKNDMNNLFNFLLITILLATSIKALFIIYSIIFPILLYKNNYYKDYFIKKNLRVIFVLIVSFSLHLGINFFSTGCLVYPEVKTCYTKNIKWAVPKAEVKNMKIHYEWWAKAGGGPNYQSKIEKKDYVKNFVWLNNWIDRHFFNKVSDSLLGIIFIGLLNLIFFAGKKKKNFKPKKILLFNVILLILFIEWFLRHPSMRYGGYVLFALPIFILLSRKLETFQITQKKLYFSTVTLILLTLTIYNLRNIKRINYEISFYGYNLIKSPFFRVNDVNFEIMDQNEKFTIYRAVSGMCWAAPTPCTNRTALKTGSFKGYKMIDNN
jgi:hypothetical protein